MKELAELKVIDLKTSSEFNEKWLQQVIADDPSIIGLGDVQLIDEERVQKRAGRLDLLLQDTDGHGRYEVEIQLGATDESHIIRTIEYWDIEKRRYPQYEHTAVIVAEDITSRFFNVIGLFNGFIPIMAMKVTAIKTADGVSLLFTKVLDTVTLGDDEEISEITDRAYWVKNASEKTVLLADKICDLVKVFASSAEFSYNKFYMGFRVDNRACNFAVCRPRKKMLRVDIRLPQTAETDDLISDAEFANLDYDKREKRYRLSLTEKQVSEKSEILQKLLEQAYERMR
ncbi:MAG: hypothetical protein MPL62_14225 [Alphaproteobacteria bacterium]|nr:hypothetical protein [Alphaproteobacteria bacterium]